MNGISIHYSIISINNSSNSKTFEDENLSGRSNAMPFCFNQSFFSFLGVLSFIILKKERVECENLKLKYYIFIYDTYKIHYA
jgi:hypothetical protein